MTGTRRGSYRSRTSILGSDAGSPVELLFRV